MCFRHGICNINNRNQNNTTTMIETLLYGLASTLANSLIPAENSNFTRAELGIIAENMGNDMTLRMSPKGNPILTNRNTSGNNVIFVLYKKDNGIIIRRRLGYENPFGSGNILNGGKPFLNIVDAMRYFKAYKAKYPNSIIG